MITISLNCHAVRLMIDQYVSSYIYSFCCEKTQASPVCVNINGGVVMLPSYLVKVRPTECCELNRLQKAGGRAGVLNVSELLYDAEDSSTCCVIRSTTSR